MTARAVLFALDDRDAARLLTCREDHRRLMELVAEVEERWDPDHLVELDKSWDALHRCFTDGDLVFGNGEFPLSHAILGDGPLTEDDAYLVCFVTAEQVCAVAAALEPLDARWIAERFAALDFPGYQGSGDADDIAYTQAYLADLQDFYRSAARHGRAVVFTVDQ
ncbi:DUF1877 family protein [Kitasatospora sp. NPDC096147]|uniref:DUF1877 family protein n=1 Tax=Kitasatospora sp. NPDC096147 TaxID=3364093 RepID=UPI0037FDB36A